MDVRMIRHYNYYLHTSLSSGTEFFSQFVTRKKIWTLYCYAFLRTVNHILVLSFNFLPIRIWHILKQSPRIVIQRSLIALRRQRILVKTAIAVIKGMMKYSIESLLLYTKIEFT